MEGGSLDADGDAPQAPCRAFIGKQVVGEHRVKIEDRIAVEADVAGGTDKEFDRVLVVEDHLRL